MAGFAVHGMDFPGFGHSQRLAFTGSEYTPGLVNDWGTDVCGALLHWAKDVKSRYADRKRLFIVGPSIGGSTALRACIEAPLLFDGAVLLCPAILHEGSAVLKAIAPVVANLCPRLQIGDIGDDDIGSKNLANAERIVQDKWRCNRPLLARTGWAAVRQLRFCETNLHRMTVPFLVIHGMKDLIIPPKGTQMLLDAAASQDKAVKWYNDGWHDLLFEPEYPQIYADIVDWISARATLTSRFPSSPPPAF